MPWYGVRNIYHFGVNSQGKNVYEERVVCIKATSFKEAHIKGITEAQTYATENKFVAHPEQLIYKQDGDALIDGYEVWSELYETDKNLAEFYSEHYEKYLYHPKNA